MLAKAAPRFASHDDARHVLRAAVGIVYYPGDVIIIYSSVSPPQISWPSAQKMLQLNWETPWAFMGSMSLL